MKRMHKTILAAVIGGVFAAPGAMADSGQSYKGELKDAWLDGKLEVAYTLNRHLNPFDIDTRVKKGVAHLSGEVDSDVERDLAREIALSIDGIVDVESDLMLDADEASEPANADSERDNARFMQRLDDVTTTATVKSRLLLNSNIDAMAINVDTENDVVVLRGNVDTGAEKDLAEIVARNAADNRDIRNELVVKEKTSNS